MKIKNLKKKYLLRKISNKYVPKEVTAHRKQGFASPMAKWLMSDLKPVCEDLLSKENFYFEEIKIEKKFPNSVKIEIKEKKAKLAWCQIIQKEILEKLRGYKAGTLSQYGMGMTMTEQLSNLSDEELVDLSHHIPTLKR